MFSTKNQFTSNQGRKKFGTSGRIVNELRREIRNSTIWTHNIPEALLRLFEHDSNRRYLPIRGNRVTKFAYSNLDVLSLLRTFEINAKEGHNGKKLYQSPLYSKYNLCSVKSYEVSPVPFKNQEEALEQWSKSHYEFERRQEYSPYGEFYYSLADTYICCLNVLLEILASNNYYKASEILFNTLNQPLYKRLDAYGIYMFLLHLNVRGVAKVDILKSLKNLNPDWESMSLDFKQGLLNALYLGKVTPDFEEMVCQQQMYYECKFSILSHEAKLFRYNTQIGRNVYEPDHLLLATYYYGIYMKMTDVEKYRDANNEMLAPARGFPTMFSFNPVSSAIQDSMPLVKETLTASFKELLATPEVKDNLKDVLKTSMEPMVEQATEKHMSVLESLKTSFQPIMDQAMTLFSSLNGVTTFFSSLIDQAMKAFPCDLFGENFKLNFSPDSLFSVLKYYILYVNVESKTLKLVLAYLMLKEIGLLEYLLRWGAEIFSAIFDQHKATTPNPTNEALKGEPTSSIDWINSIMNMLTSHTSETSLCIFFTTLLYFIFRHVQAAGKAVPRFNEYSTIAGVVVGVCKNLHWVGSGMFGIDRIYKYFVIITQSLTKFIRKNYLGINDDSLANEKKIAKWLIQLKFFSTDTGRSAIRVSNNLLLKAEKIMPDGLGFISAYSQDKNFVSRETMMQVHRSWQDVKVLANFTYRLRSTSTFKPAMFHVQFVGEPGVGKSTLTENFIKSISDKIYPKDKNVTHWSHDTNNDYFDGYSKQTFMIIDDLFRFNEPKHLSLIIGLITNTPITLPMAHLEDKGMDLDSDFLISSTNTPYPIGKDIFCMEAVHRRRHVLVEVKCDPRVKNNGKFSKELFSKFYPGKNSKDFPHLTFNLMKSTILPGENRYQSTSAESEKYKHDLIRKMKEANQTLRFDEEFYFGENARPPGGMQVPCTGWSYETFVANAAACYLATRAEENKLTSKEKYEHVMTCFAEIDNIFSQSDDVLGGLEADRFCKLISDQFLDASYQYGSDDPLGERVYNSEASILPDADNLDIDSLISEFVEAGSGTPTAGSVYEDCQPSTSELTIYEKCLRAIQSGKYKDPILSILHSLIYKDLKKMPFSHFEEEVMDHVFNGTPSPILIDITPKNESSFEGSRRFRIMEKIKKNLTDPLYENSLSMKHIYKDDKVQTFLPIRSHYTEWALQVDTFPGESFMDYIQSNESMEYIMSNYPCNVFDRQTHNKIQKFFHEINSGMKLTFPKTKLYSDLSSSNSLMSIEFLRRLEYLQGEWHMKCDDIDVIGRGVIKHQRMIQGENKFYYIPIDFAYLCSMHKGFTYTANIFSLLSTQQQSKSVELAKWTYQHMYDLSTEGIRERLFSIADFVKRKVMGNIFYTLQWIWDRMVSIAFIVARLAIAGSCIYLLRTFAKMIRGDQEPTSKFLHRNQVKTGIQFRGSFQSGLFNSNNTQEQMAQNYLNKNVKFFSYCGEDNIQRIAHGIHTKQFLIINAHTAQTFSEGRTVLKYTPTTVKDTRWEIEINPKQVYILPNNDLAIIFSRDLPMAKDILNQFITDEDFDTTENVGELWCLTNFMNQQSVEIRDKSKPYRAATLIADDGREGHISKAIAVEGTTVAGKSGSMLIRPSKKPGHRSIVGIQAWKVRDYYTYQVYYQVVTQEMLKIMIEQVEKQVGRPVISQEGPLWCEPTSAKIEGIVDSHINIEGSVPKECVVGLVGKTQFRKTVISSHMDEDGFMSPRVPAALNPWDHRLLVKEHPMKHSVNKSGTGKVGTFDLAILDRASQDMAYWLRDRLDQSSFNTNLSLEEVITGIRAPGSNPVDCRKSAGLPYVLDKYPGKPKGKKAYVDIDENGQCLINDQEFVKKFETTYQKLCRGEIPLHSSYDFPKDELRPYYKALGDPVMGTPPKTRSVTCMSMEFIFAWRRVTLDLMASLHRAARGNFPFGPGINPEGPDWTRLFHYLSKHPNAVDFDVSNWDGHMPPELLYAVGDMLCIIMNISYNSPEAKVIYSLLTEVLFGHVQFQDLVYQKCRGLISGFPGTAEMNTLVHLLLMYYFYLYTASLTDNSQYATITDFFYHCSSVFYGDDVILSVSNEILPWFNGQTIAVMYREHGYPVTSANKLKEIPKRQDLMDCTFLKSGFRIVDASRVERVMDLSVCYDLMYWVRAKEHPYDQFRSNLFDAFRLIHGHGASTYEEVRTQVNRWLKKSNLEPFDLRWEIFENDKIQKYYS